MPHVVQPDIAWHESFVEAVREFHAHPEPPPWFVASLDAGAPASSEAFEAYVAGLRAEPHEETRRPPGFVPATTPWWVEGDQFLGRCLDRRGPKPRFLVPTHVPAK